MIALCSSFVMKGASLAQTYFFLIGACLLNMQKQFHESILDFFLWYNFECMSIYNHGKPQCEVSVIQGRYLILLQLSYESR